MSNNRQRSGVSISAKLRNANLLKNGDFSRQLDDWSIEGVVIIGQGGGNNNRAEFVLPQGRNARIHQVVPELRFGGKFLTALQIGSSTIGESDALVDVGLFDSGPSLRVHLYNLTSIPTVIFLELRVSPDSTERAFSIHGPAQNNAWWVDDVVLVRSEAPDDPDEELIRDGNFSEAGHPDWVLENAEIYDTDPPLSAHAVLGFGDAHIAQKIRPQKEGTYLLRFDLMSPEDWPERPGRVIISVGGHVREDPQEFGSDGNGEYVGMIFLLEFTKDEVGRDDVEMRIAKVVQPGLRVIWHIDNVSLRRITPPT